MTVFDPAFLGRPLKPIGGPEVGLHTAVDIARDWGMPRDMMLAFTLMAEASPIAWSHKNRDNARAQLEVMKRSWWALSSYQRRLMRETKQMAFPIGTRVRQVSNGPVVYVVRSDIEASDVSEMLCFDPRIRSVPGHLRSALAAPSKDECVTWITAALGCLKGLIDTLGESVHG